MNETITGIINIHKPQEWTSHDCVAVMRRVLGIKRIGHTGTLDPMATGVLPVCIGTATRIMEYLDLDMKTYRCQMKLGLVSDTLDVWGEVQETTGAETVTAAQIRQAFEPFNGLISQIPPKYSALKVKGRKLYEYAREGKDVEIRPRKVFLERVAVEEIDLTQKTVTWTVRCSKGTYIRSICRDIGAALGCGAVMTALCRTESGAFSLEQAADIRRVREMSREEALSLLLPADYPLTHFGKGLLSKRQAEIFCNGGSLPLADVTIQREPEYREKTPHIPVRDAYRNAYNLYRQENGREVFLGVAVCRPQEQRLTADKVFYRG